MSTVPPEGQSSSKAVPRHDTRNPGGQQIRPPDESRTLISARKVDGTRILNSIGEVVGSVHDLMIEKRTGRIAFAVISLGGFLGIGERYHPVPWAELRFDPDRGGYVLRRNPDDLRTAPTLSADEIPAFESGGYDRRVLEFYGIGGSRSDIGPPL
jgi:sporulation protein YlmC with PRC-barrel domain